MTKSAGWADEAIADLKNGELVTITPRGKSMTGIIDDGQEVRLEPVGPSAVNIATVLLYVGDVVLCEVDGKQYLHRILKSSVGAPAEIKFLIGNAHGGVNGWVTREFIYGRVLNLPPRRPQRTRRPGRNPNTFTRG